MSPDMPWWHIFFVIFEFFISYTHTTQAERRAETFQLRSARWPEDQKRLEKKKNVLFVVCVCVLTCNCLYSCACAENVCVRVLIWDCM